MTAVAATPHTSTGASTARAIVDRTPSAPITHGRRAPTSQPCSSRHWTPMTRPSSSRVTACTVVPRRTSAPARSPRRRPAIGSSTARRGAYRASTPYDGLIEIVVTSPPAVDVVRRTAASRRRRRRRAGPSAPAGRPRCASRRGSTARRAPTGRDRRRAHPGPPAPGASPSPRRRGGHRRRRRRDESWRGWARGERTDGPLLPPFPAHRPVRPAGEGWRKVVPQARHMHPITCHDIIRTEHRAEHRPHRAPAP